MQTKKLRSPHGGQVPVQLKSQVDNRLMCPSHSGWRRSHFNSCSGSSPATALAPHQIFPNILADRCGPSSKLLHRFGSWPLDGLGTWRSRQSMSQLWWCLCTGPQATREQPTCLTRGTCSTCPCHSRSSSKIAMAMQGCCTKRNAAFRHNNTNQNKTCRQQQTNNNMSTKNNLQVCRGQVPAEKHQ